MPIPVITNFTINDRVPFDTRLVATNSNAMYNMDYPYEGLTIYRTDLRRNFTFNGETWSVSSNGIYGGDGALANSNTVVGFGTVSSTVDTTSSNLTFRSYSGNSGIIYLDLKNTFIRNSEDTNATFNTVSYKTQLNFTNTNGSTVINGPFISYNPYSSFGYGGISFATYDLANNDVYERVIVEGGEYGLIRFFVEKQPSQASKSLNIGGNSSGGLGYPFIGYGWSGFGIAGNGAWIEFNDNQLDIMVKNEFADSLLSASFTTDGITLNGNTSVVGGLTVNGSISGPVRNTFNIGRGSSGFGFLTDRVALQYGGQRVGYFNSTTFATEKNVLTTTNIAANTSSFQIPTFTLGSRGLIVDPKFNPNANIVGESDLTFVNILKSRINETDTFNNFEQNKIYIYQQVKSARSDNSEPQDGRFRLAAKSYVSNLAGADCAYAEYVTPVKSYDRIIYFYHDSLSFHIPHRFSWYIGNYTNSELLNSRTNPWPSRWKKIGVVETSNIDNINSNYGATPLKWSSVGETATKTGGYPNFNNNPSFSSEFLDYQIRTYSQMVILPAGSVLKIRFDFSYSWESTIVDSIISNAASDFWGYCPSLVFVSQRMGNYTLAGGESDIRIKQDGITTNKRSGADYQYPYEKFVTTTSPLQTWGKQT